MAWTVESSGTQTATISTEHTLLNTSTAKTFILQVDTSAMLSGDTLELLIYVKVLTGGTLGVAYAATFSHLQSNPIKISLPVVASAFTTSASFRLRQKAGTGRAFPWSVLSTG